MTIFKQKKIIKLLRAFSAKIVNHSEVSSEQAMTKVEIKVFFENSTVKPSNCKDVQYKL